MGQRKRSNPQPGGEKSPLPIDQVIQLALERSKEEVQQRASQQSLRVVASASRQTLDSGFPSTLESLAQPQLSQHSHLEEKIAAVVENCLKKNVHLQSLMTQKEQLSQPQPASQPELGEVRQMTLEMQSQLKTMQKGMDNMQMSINEKEAEIIRLNMVLGDERKRNGELIKMASGPLEGTPVRNSAI